MSNSSCTLCHLPFVDIGPVEIGAIIYARCSRFWASLAARNLACEQRFCQKDPFAICDWSQLALWFIAPSVLLSAIPPAAASTDMAPPRGEIRVRREIYECGLPSSDTDTPPCDMIVCPQWDVVSPKVLRVLCRALVNSTIVMHDDMDKTHDKVASFDSDGALERPEGYTCLSCALRRCTCDAYMRKSPPCQQFSASNMYWTCRYWRRDVYGKHKGAALLTRNETSTWIASLANTLDELHRIVAQCESVVNTVSFVLETCSAVYKPIAAAMDTATSTPTVETRSSLAHYAKRICNRVPIALLGAMNPQMMQLATALEICLEAQHAPQWKPENSSQCTTAALGYHLFKCALIQSSEMAEFSTNWTIHCQSAEPLRSQGLVFSLFGGMPIYGIITALNISSSVPCVDIVCGRQLHNERQLSLVRRAFCRANFRNGKTERDLGSEPVFMFVVPAVIATARRMKGCLACSSSMYCCHASPDVVRLDEYGNGAAVALLSPEDFCLVWPKLVEQAALVDTFVIAQCAYHDNPHRMRLGRACECMSCCLSMPKKEVRGLTIAEVYKRIHLLDPALQGLYIVDQEQNLCDEWSIYTSRSKHSMSDTMDTSWPSIRLFPYTPFLFERATLQQKVRELLRNPTGRATATIATTATSSELVFDTSTSFSRNFMRQATAGASAVLEQANWDPKALLKWLPPCLIGMCRAPDSLLGNAQRQHLYHAERRAYCHFYKQLESMDYTKLLHAMYEVLRTMTESTKARTSVHETQALTSFATFVSSASTGATYCAEIEDIARRPETQGCNAAIVAGICCFAKFVPPEQMSAVKSSMHARPEPSAKMRKRQMDPRYQACTETCALEFQRRFGTLPLRPVDSPASFFACAYSQIH